MIDDRDLTPEILQEIGFSVHDGRLEMMIDDEHGIAARTKDPLSFYFSFFSRHEHLTIGIVEDSMEVFPDPKTVSELQCFIYMLTRYAVSIRE